MDENQIKNDMLVMGFLGVSTEPVELELTCVEFLNKTIAETNKRKTFKQYIEEKEFKKYVNELKGGTYATI